MILDKGFRVIYEWSGDDGEYTRQGDKFREFYFSLPFEVVCRLRENLNSVYLKGGIALDADLERKPGYAAFAASVVLGAGRSFIINDVMRVSIEPTFRYGLDEYGKDIWIFEHRKEKYRPLSFGIVIALTQLETAE
jgi:hypothetical protein